MSKLTALDMSLQVTMFPEPHIPIPPPGQERKYPDPGKHGRIPFTYTAAAIEGETAYWIWGDLSSNKVPLIVLHGGPGMSHTYMLPLSLVSQDFGVPVVMYDQIGGGESTRFPERKGDEQTWTLEFFIAELENVISALGIEQFDLMGHSWGAALAAVFATRKQPSGLRKLIICNLPTDLARMAESSARLRKQMPIEVQEILNRCERDDDFSRRRWNASFDICIHAPWLSRATLAEGVVGHLRRSAGGQYSLQHHGRIFRLDDEWIVVQDAWFRGE